MFMKARSGNVRGNSKARAHVHLASSTCKEDRYGLGYPTKYKRPTYLKATKPNNSRERF